MASYSPARQRTKISLILVALSLFLIALARPQIGTKLEEVKRKGVDIIVAVDVSLSMMAEDIKPSRLEKAKHEVASLINRLEGDRIGLIVFAGEAFVLGQLRGALSRHDTFPHCFRIAPWRVGGFIRLRFGLVRVGAR